LDFLVINAFHPQYVQTYMPQFLSTIRKEAEQKANGQKYGSIARATRESDGTKPSGLIQSFPKTKRVSTDRTDFYVYSRAGAPKGKK
jgi:hypothetical protein